MFNIPRHRRSTDKGMTLVEVLVAIFLLSIVGTIVAGVVITAMHLTRTTTSGVDAQSQLNDSVSRITRDIAASDPILTVPANWDGHGITASPTKDDIWVQSVQGNKCVRTRYFVDDPANPKQLKSWTYRLASSDCPDPQRYIGQTATGVSFSEKILIRDLKTTADDGTTAPVFTYFNKANTAFPTTTAVSGDDVPKIARVKVDVGSNVDNRAKGVRLSTSVAPRTMDNPLMTAGPRPQCTDVKAVVTFPDQHVTPAPPTISWSYTEFADTFTLWRSINGQPETLVGVYTDNPGSVADTAMSGRTNVTIDYRLDVEGPAGSAIADPAHPEYCDPPPAPTGGANGLSAPAVTATVTPDTSAAPSAVTNPAVNLNWGTVTRATEYQVWRRPIDPNVAPYNFTGTGTWTLVSTVTGTSYTDNPGFNQAFDYYVVARNTAYKDGANGDPLVSPTSNIVKALTHTTSVTLNGVAYGYGVNRLTWTAVTGSTADGYALFRRPNGTTDWGTPLWSTGNTATTTYDDYDAANGTKYDYLITSYNIGPRGTTYPGDQRYYGAPSNVATVLQYPAVPKTTAHGSETNPDGTNSATWPAVPTATSYKVYEADANSPTATATVTAPVGTNLSYTDSGYPRGTRNFYMAVACNPTGCSENDLDATNRASNYSASTRVYSAAYQRPVTTDNTLLTAPDLNQNGSTGSFTPNADAGEPTDRFCTENASICTYKLDRDGALLNTVDGVTAANTAATNGGKAKWNGTGNWGEHHLMSVASCNPGGCATDSNTVVVDHYPGPFWFTNWGVTGEARYYKTTVISNVSHVDQPGTIAPSWAASAGARFPYMATKTVGGDDPFARNYGNYYYNGYNGPVFQATPGTTNYVSITATSAQNNLTRTITGSIRTPPPTVAAYKEGAACTTNLGNWKEMWQVVTNATSYGAMTPANEVHERWWAGRLTQTEFNSGAAAVAKNNLMAYWDAGANGAAGGWARSPWNQTNNYYGPINPGANTGTDAIRYSPGVVPNDYRDSTASGASLVLYNAATNASWDEGPRLLGATTQINPNGQGPGCGSGTGWRPTNDPATFTKYWTDGTGYGDTNIGGWNPAW